MAGVEIPPVFPLVASFESCQRLLKCKIAVSLFVPLSLLGLHYMQISGRGIYSRAEELHRLMSLINKAGQTDRQLAERILEFSPQTGGWAGDINTCQQVQKD